MSDVIDVEAPEGADDDLYAEGSGSPEREGRTSAALGLTAGIAALSSIGPITFGLVAEGIATVLLSPISLRTLPAAVLHLGLAAATSLTLIVAAFVVVGFPTSSGPLRLVFA